MFTKLIEKDEDCDCWEWFSACCDCGGNGCGCSGCVSCYKCDRCNEEEDD